MRSIICFALAALLAGVLGSDNQKFANGYVPATDGFPSHKTYRSQEDYYDRLAYLAPSITQAILDGSQPASLTLSDLIERDIPVSWTDQRRAFGFL